MAASVAHAFVDNHNSLLEISGASSVESSGFGSLVVGDEGDGLFGQPAGCETGHVDGLGHQRGGVVPRGQL